MDAKTKALLMIATNFEIRTFLRRNDPMALEQVEKALGPDRPTPAKYPKTFEIEVGKERFSAEELAASWGCEPAYDRAPNEKGDGCLFYNFGVEGNDPEFLKKFIPAIDRTIKGHPENKQELTDLKDEVMRRLRVLGSK